MFYAISQEKGRVSARALANHRVKLSAPLHGKKRAELICPFCRTAVHLVEKKAIQPYFRHCSLIECEYEKTGKGKTPWHQAMQNLFAECYQEAVVSTKISPHMLKRHSHIWGFPNEYEDAKRFIDIKHIADVRYGNVVVEFQHSKMTPEEFAYRTWFYNVNHCFVVWVFDVSEEDMQVVDASPATTPKLENIIGSNTTLEWNWLNPKPTFELVSPAVQRLLPNFALYFCRRAKIKGSEKKGYKLEDALLYRVNNCKFERSNNGSRGFNVPHTSMPVTVFTDMHQFSLGDIENRGKNLTLRQNLTA